MMSAMGSIFGGDQGGSYSKGDMLSITNGPLDFIPTEIEKLRSELGYLIEEHGKLDEVHLEENERGITIHIQGDILFKSGSAVLGDGSEVVLADLAEILRKIDNDIRIEGHTDNIPIASNIYLSNWHLSIERALNTAYYLINTENLPPEKVSVVGYAEYKPLQSNDTPEGRAANRRVDIVIIKE